MKKPHPLSSPSKRTTSTVARPPKCVSCRARSRSTSTRCSRASSSSTRVARPAVSPTATTLTHPWRGVRCRVYVKFSCRVYVKFTLQCVCVWANSLGCLPQQPLCTTFAVPRNTTPTVCKWMHWLARSTVATASFLPHRRACTNGRVSRDLRRSALLVCAVLVAAFFCVIVDNV